MLMLKLTKKKRERKIVTTQIYYSFCFINIICFQLNQTTTKYVQKIYSTIRVYTIKFSAKLFLLFLFEQIRCSYNCNFFLFFQELLEKFYGFICTPEFSRKKKMNITSSLWMTCFTLARKTRSLTVLFCHIIRSGSFSFLVV